VVTLVKKKTNNAKSAPHAVLRSLDIVSAILLLTGQVTIGGVFIAIEGFALSLSGPFTGSGAVGKTPNASFVLDVLDVMTALLLIVGEIDVIGTYITANRFTIVVGGPPFGTSKINAYSPAAKEFFDDYSDMVLQKYQTTRNRKR
jgi:hypothetical protein